MILFLNNIISQLYLYTGDGVESVLKHDFILTFVDFLDPSYNTEIIIYFIFLFDKI